MGFFFFLNWKLFWEAVCELQSIWLSFYQDVAALSASLLPHQLLICHPHSLELVIRTSWFLACGAAIQRWGCRSWLQPHKGSVFLIIIPSWHQVGWRKAPDWQQLLCLGIHVTSLESQILERTSRISDLWFRTRLCLVLAWSLSSCTPLNKELLWLCFCSCKNVKIYVKQLARGLRHSSSFSSSLLKGICCNISDQKNNRVSFGIIDISVFAWPWGIWNPQFRRMNCLPVVTEPIHTPILPWAPVDPQPLLWLCVVLLVCF